MESRLWKLFAAIVLLLLVGSQQSSASDCLYSHPQSYFCNSEEVIRAKFLREAEMKNSVNGYELQITEVFKGSYWSTGTSIRIKFSTGAAIDLRADPGDFVLTGSGSPDLQVSGCSMVKPWSELTTKQAMGIRGAYKDGCSCEIISSFPKPGESKDQHCKLDDDSANQVANQACIPKGGICSWQTIN
ncbi:hypothetical protein NDU88_000962 [Pleurodeles waltl]|uniref:NTR domain-containing protein n=1 Tax=Pleurodeles waltl TaxID=8319 RepID=A0AAV7LZM5_PLEWA|nr:hypothetical protein NDU88_000962 [Pleurodeles waltl]